MSGGDLFVGSDGPLASPGQQGKTTPVMGELQEGNDKTGGPASGRVCMPSPMKDCLRRRRLVRRCRLTSWFRSLQARAAMARRRMERQENPTLWATCMAFSMQAWRLAHAARQGWGQRGMGQLKRQLVRGRTVRKMRGWIPSISMSKKGFLGRIHLEKANKSCRMSWAWRSWAWRGPKTLILVGERSQSTLSASSSLPAPHLCTPLSSTPL